ncbi:MAG: hypothetical protein IJ373_02850 [Clostridia bacterium]|nr:hypothetical protein [Clostridia bacterium]
MKDVKQLENELEEIKQELKKGFVENAENLKRISEKMDQLVKSETEGSIA